MAKRQQGVVTSWNDVRGFGFVETSRNGPRAFLHIKAFRNTARRPIKNDVVLFRPGKDGRGRSRAEDVVFAGTKPVRARPSGRPRQGRFSIIFAVLFLLGVGASFVVTALPWQVPAAYVVLSLMTFLLYARDKSAARKGRWRTPENTLHAIALLGGWPGALLAQQSLRHKSKKTVFRAVLWLTVLLNTGALIWLHTPEGRVELDRFISDVRVIGAAAQDAWSDRGGR